ncbi:MAG: hypothetical protein IKU28_07620 [Erysipelotrichaceae bacterium]|nr:hypothetical protein [Erysipelotrichaceae bacterium]
MKIIKNILLVFFFIALCGCNETSSSSSSSKYNNLYNFKEIDDISLIEREFLKSVHFYIAPKELIISYDEDAEIVQYINISEYGEFFIYRMKKSEGYEDITADLNLQWNTQNEDIREDLSGIVGEGTIKFEQFSDGKKTNFKGGIWYDDLDKMVYSILSLGENPALMDVKDIFEVGTRIDIHIDSYEDADHFLKTYAGGNNCFFRSETNGRTEVCRYENTDQNYITYMVGDELNYVYKLYHEDGYYQEWIYETDSETGYTTQTEYETYNNAIIITKYTNEGKCISTSTKMLDTGYYYVTEYSENGDITYLRDENDQEVREYFYDEHGGRATRNIKTEDYTIEYTFKKMMIHGKVEYPYLTISSKYNDQYYTYASEDSHIITKYEAFDKTNNTRYEWFLDGTSNDTDAVTLLIVTKESGSTQYTHSQIPWGTGMIYPPKDPGEFYMH